MLLGLVRWSPPSSSLIRLITFSLLPPWTFPGGVFPDDVTLPSFCTCADEPPTSPYTRSSTPSTSCTSNTLSILTASANSACSAITCAKPAATRVRSSNSTLVRCASSAKNSVLACVSPITCCGIPTAAPASSRVTSSRPDGFTTVLRAPNLVMLLCFEALICDKVCCA